MTGLVNSAGSHVLEPVDLWQRELPPSMRDRGPVTETAGDREIRDAITGGNFARLFAVPDPAAA